MKLSAIQIKKIDDSLKSQGLFYEDVRNEMIDHIATELEFEGVDNNSFKDALSRYMNSHKIVKLVSAAKKHQEFKDHFYHREFLRQFVTGRGVAVLAVILAVLFTASKLGWMMDILLTIFLILMTWAMFGINGMQSSRNLFLIRLYKQVKFYFLAGVVLMSLAGHYYSDSEIFEYTKTIVLGFAFTGFYFMHNINSKYNAKGYA
ncbi:MAG: hypothetical protein EOO45_27010 [Flavobacterium sp.]|nr:MAG: hypothetical protein EOO45_27010 [Flavobacterium sp.]